MDRPESQSARETHKYHKGSRVVCPNPKCSQPIGLLTRDLKIGDTILASDIKYYTHEYNAGDRSECHKCGSVWGMNTSKGPMLFINNGWVCLPSKQKPPVVRKMPKPAIIIPKK